ncbi:WD40 repeat-like protein [Irpex rosettiformis]|uniref:WD40 repeat-like protein n=1 Tax=Irpex rosettiformis TaxID=378272 RepID=A0ACB8UE72_9APHY|nr:WD40 repeat-like protein [Irpex rosettiformis]
MRVQHTAFPLPNFPVYSSAFVSDDELVIGGGGGQSKSGIKNKLRLYKVQSGSIMTQLDELELEKGEDAPMSMTAIPETKTIVCGINSAEDGLKDGLNQNCRTYTIEADKISFQASTSTLKPDSVNDDYQKVTILSPDHKFLAIAGTKDLSLLEYPSLKLAANPITIEKGEIYDATFSETTLVVATTINLLVYTLPALDATLASKKAGKKKEMPVLELELYKTIDRPDLPGVDGGSSFRAVRYHPQDSKVLYTVLNTVPPRSQKKNAPRRAFICKWNAEKWVVTRPRKVSDRGLTCFDVSADGKFVAYGSSDYSVGVLDGKTLAPLLTILKTHEFPPTTLKFNPSASLLVSGSADNSVRLISVPDNLTAASWSTWIVVLVTLLIIIFAIIAGQMQHAY